MFTINIYRFKMWMCPLLTWDRTPRESSWKRNKCESWSGSSHWSLGKAVLHTASPRHPSEAASGQENSSSLQTWPTSAKRCSPQWTLCCQGCWAWRPVLQAPTSLWPTESQRYLKATSRLVFSTALKIKLQLPRLLCKSIFVAPKTCLMIETEQAFTSLVEAFRKSTAAREHIQCAIFGHFNCLRSILRVLWFLCSGCLPFAFTC